MSLKDQLLSRAMKLMSDPRVMKIMSNPKVMNVAMKAFQLPGKAQAAIDARKQQFAKALNLATRDEIRELKSALKNLEEALKK